MKKQMRSLLMALALCLSLLPGTAWAAEEPQSAPEDKSGGWRVWTASILPTERTVFTAGGGTITWEPVLGDDGVPEGGTVTLTDAEINAEWGGITLPVSFTLVLEGHSTITTQRAESTVAHEVAFGIFSQADFSQADPSQGDYSFTQGDLTIVGPGSLTVTSAGRAVAAFHDLTIQDGADISIQSSYTGFCLTAQEGDLTIRDSTVRASIVGSQSTNSGVSANSGRLTVENSYVFAENQNGPAMEGRQVLLKDSDVAAIGNTPGYAGAISFGVSEGSFLMDGGTLYVENTASGGYDLRYYEQYASAVNNAVIYYSGTANYMIQNGDNIQFASCVYDASACRVTRVGAGYVRGSLVWDASIPAPPDYFINAQIHSIDFSAPAWVLTPSTVTIPAGVEAEIPAINLSLPQSRLVNNGTLTSAIGIRCFGVIEGSGTLNAVVQTRETVDGTTCHDTFTAHGDASFKASFTKIGETTAADSGAVTVSTLSIPAGASLTVPAGALLDATDSGTIDAGTLAEYYENSGTLVINGTAKFPADSGGLGRITNNGTVVLEGECHAGDIPAYISSLGLTGTGTVEVSNRDAGGGTVTATYTNSGVRLVAGDLDFSGAAAPAGDLETDGYHWDAANQCLELKNIALSGSVRLPDGAVTIVTAGESRVGALAFQNTGDINLTFAGEGTLTVVEQINIASGDYNTLTVDETARVAANGGIYVGESGGVNSLVTVNGVLTAKGGDSVYDPPAIFAGSLAIGDTGTLTVSGAQGVLLGGMPRDGDAAYSRLLTVTGGGCFTADCSAFNVRVGDGTYTFPADFDAEGVVSDPGRYLPADCAVRQNGGQVDLIRESTGQVYTGPMTIHENHDYSGPWQLNESGHWKECTFAGCGRTAQHAAHSYSGGVCSVCGHPQPGGEPVIPPDKPVVPPNEPSRPSGGRDTDSVYAVAVEEARYGAVTSDRDRASSGSSVNLIVTAADGYVLDSLTVTDSRGTEAALESWGGGRYSFIMPSRSVTISAVFAPRVCGGGGDCPSRAFSDLDTGKWYHEAVDYVLEAGLMDGCGGGLFRPDAAVTRAQLAQLLYNRAGRPDRGGGAGFSDVAAGAWYAPAVSWAAAQGIVEGYPDRQFAPAAPVTREQLAVVLWRSSGSPAAVGELTFSDAGEASGYAGEALLWAVERGLLAGKPGGLLEPRAPATRAQLAQVLWSLWGRS